jgi:molecular chaperone GrpE (heat shock protein)
VIEVYRTGYTFRSRVLRPALVVVARRADEAEG